MPNTKTVIHTQINNYNTTETYLFKNMFFPEHRKKSRLLKWTGKVEIKHGIASSENPAHA